MRKPSLTLGAMLILAFAGCDKSKSATEQDADVQRDAATIDAAARRDGAGQSDGTTQTDGAGQADGAQTPDGAGREDGGGIPYDGGPGGFSITFGTIDLWANCMPIVPPDPWHLDFDLIYDNTAGSSPVNVTILTTKIVFHTTGDPTLEVNVNPTQSGTVAAGTSSTVNHAKTSSVNDLPNDCDLCAYDAHLEVTVDIGGQVYVLTSPTLQFTCPV